jgi:hypothetical protein
MEAGGIEPPFEDFQELDLLIPRTEAPLARPLTGLRKASRFKFRTTARPANGGCLASVKSPGPLSWANSGENDSGG